MSLTERRASSEIFAVDVKCISGEMVLALHGELDAWTRQLFIDALARVEDSTSRIVLDLADLTFIDVGNTRLIHRSRTLARLRGTELVLRSPNPAVLRILTLTGLCAGTASADGIRPTELPLPAQVSHPPRRRAIRRTVERASPQMTSGAYEASS